MLSRCFKLFLSYLSDTIEDPSYSWTLKWQGVMMSHGNIVATVAGVTTILPNLSSSDSYLAYLPLAHVLELLAEV